MATSSIGKVVKLDQETGRKMAKILKNPHEPVKSKTTIKSGRVTKEMLSKIK